MFSLPRPSPRLLLLGGAAALLLVLLTLTTLFSRYLPTNLSQSLTDGQEALIGGELAGDSLSAGEHTVTFRGKTQSGAVMTETTEIVVGTPDPTPSPTPSPSFTALDLPVWYEQERLQLHSQFSAVPVYFNKDYFYQRAARFAALGAPPVVAIGIKSESNVGAWWPSSVGSIWTKVSQEGRDIAQELIDDLHHGGQRAIIYYRHATDSLEAQTHPDWRCLNINGAEQTHGAAHNIFMSLSSPYATFVQTRMRELTQRGADGFYFDFTHQPPLGCFDDFTKRAFTARTGLQPPTSVSKRDPIYRQYVAFQAQVIEETLGQWKQAIKDVNSDAVVLISANVWPRLTTLHLTNRLFQIADSVKTEFDIGARSGGVYPPPTSMRPRPEDVGIALSYTLARDAADGRPPHIWFYRPNSRNAQAMRYGAAGIMTHGGIANLHLEPLVSPEPYNVTAEHEPLYRPAFELARQVSPYLAGTRPVKWAAVHFNERARDLHASSDQELWQYANYPFFSMFEVLFRERVPVGVVTDSQLDAGKLEGYNVLVLPAPNNLTPAQQAHVTAFEQRGGLVIRNRPEWEWHHDSGYVSARQSFLGRMPNRIQTAPVRVNGGPAALHAVSFQAPGNPDRMLVAIANDFTKAKEDTFSPPPPATGVSITLRSSRQPQQVRDVVTGQILTASKVENKIQIDVPPVEAMALIEVTY